MPHGRAPEVALRRETRYPVGDAAHYGRIKPGLAARWSATWDTRRTWRPPGLPAPEAVHRSGTRTTRGPTRVWARTLQACCPTIAHRPMPRFRSGPTCGGYPPCAGGRTHLRSRADPLRSRAIHPLTANTEEHRHVARTHQTRLGSSGDLGDSGTQREKKPRKRLRSQSSLPTVMLARRAASSKASATWGSCSDWRLPRSLPPLRWTMSVLPLPPGSLVRSKPRHPPRSLCSSRTGRMLAESRTEVSS